MVWVLVFGGIALAGLIVLLSYAVWLLHKLGDLASEFEMLGKRAAELEALLGQIQTTHPQPTLPRPTDTRTTQLGSTAAPAPRATTVTSAPSAASTTAWSQP